jgi:hypothetical protein
MKTDLRAPAPALDARIETLVSIASLVAVLAVMLGVYAAALNVDFVGDDVLILTRLREAGGLRDAAAYFQQGFFEYYRPIAFLSHAVDWHLWGENPAGFHATSLLLHALNTLLVFGLGRRLGGPLAGGAAAVLFALQPSNSEAVVWISARFDLMATFWLLLALHALIRPGPGWYAAGVAAFGLALLSKESALALPLIVAGHDVLLRRLGPMRVVARLAPLLAVLGAYAVLRSAAGDLPLAGGTGRLPKIAMIATGLLLLIHVSREGWPRWSARLLPVRRTAAPLAALLLAGLAAGAWTGPAASFLREKFSFLGFAGFHLASPIVSPAPPPYFLDPETSVYWLAGLAVAAGAASLALAWWKPIVSHPPTVFLIVFIAAALIPVSSMTEGKRYLYLASAGVALLVGVTAARFTGRGRRAALALLLIAGTVSAWQASLKVADWRWAGDMTREAIALVDATLAPRCGGEVVLLTAPVGIRDVYSHLYRESFALPRGCPPDRVRTVIRVVRLDSRIDVAWDGPTSLTLQARDYRGNMVTARDHRHFDVPVAAGVRQTLLTPLGVLDMGPAGPDHVFRMALASAEDPRTLHVFFYSDGALHHLEPAVESRETWAAGKVHSRAPSGYNGIPLAEPGPRAPGTFPSGATP